MDTTEQILVFLEAEKQQMIADLEELVMIESPSTDPNHITLAYDFLVQQLELLNYYTLWHPGKSSGGCLYGRPLKKGKNQAIQLLIGHIDTVWPLGTLNKMPVVLNEERLTGPGVYDMKAGIIQIIYALKAIEHLSISPDLMPVVLINSDEEVGSKESTALISCLSKLASRAFILEPSVGYEGKLKTRRSGVGKYTIKIKGEAAHAGLDPGKGASAIVELSHVIQKLFALNEPAEGVSVNVGMIDGGVRPNVIAPESTAVVDVRVPTIEDANRIDLKIRHIQPENSQVELKVEGGIGRPPMEGTAANRALWQLARTKASMLSFKLLEATAGGGSDGNTTSQYTATLDGLGATGDGAHAIHEFVFVDKLIERSALLSLLILADPLESIERF